MAFVLVIPRKGGVDAGFGRQIRRRRCDGLDARLFIAGHDRYPAPLCLGRGLFSGHPR
jgi:hypothetical protein